MITYGAAVIASVKRYMIASAMRTLNCVSLTVSTVLITIQCKNIEDYDVTTYQ
jgi:hypothetical protein